MQLEDFYDYKNQLMEDILTNREIVNPINENVDVEDAAQLAYEQVFPCEYVPNTVEHGKTIVCFDVDVTQSLGKPFIKPVLYVWVMTHKSLLRLPEGGVRTDKLCSEICKVINGSRKYGLGELELYSISRFAPMTDFQGKAMVFNAVEFNRTYDPNKFTPSNRKKP